MLSDRRSGWKEMTSSVARAVEREYRLWCSCGARVKTSEKQAICADCGLTFEIRRIKGRIRSSQLRTLWHTASPIEPKDVLLLVEKPATYIALYLLLFYDLYDLLHC
jgi:hypothetical protein